MSKTTKADLKAEIAAVAGAAEVNIKLLTHENQALRLELNTLRDRVKMIAELFKAMVSPG